MVWGWAVASIFILFVGLGMAELASAAPTSGGVSRPNSKKNFSVKLEVDAVL